MFYVYVLKSLISSRIYIGHSEDLCNRVTQHQAHASKATAPYNDWQLVHSEIYSTRALAMKREKFFKSGDGRKVLKLKGIL